MKRFFLFLNHMRLRYWKQEDGFVLIEVAIAMIIFGLIFGPGFMAWHTHNTARKHRTTLYHQKLVFQALAQHFEINGCLPYPSALAENARGSGQRPTILKTGEPIKPGIVPYRTLGLPMRVAKDGFGHWMTYAVDKNWTSPMYFQDQMCAKFFATPSPLDVIECGKSVQQGILENSQIYKPIKNTLGQETKKQRFDGIAVILISHGREGWGALMSDGKRIPFPRDALPDQASSGEDRLVFTAPDPNGPTHSSRYTTVAWKTRTQIMAETHLRCFDYFFEKTAPQVLQPQGSFRENNGLSPSSAIPTRPLTSGPGYAQTPNRPLVTYRFQNGPSSREQTSSESSSGSQMPSGQTSENSPP